MSEYSTIQIGEELRIWKNTPYLNLSKRGITKIPDLSDFTELEYLDVSGNKDLSDLPVTLAANRKLIAINIVDTEIFGYKSEVFNFLPNLQLIISNDNTPTYCKFVRNSIKWRPEIYKYLCKQNQEEIKTLVQIYSLRTDKTLSRLPIELLYLIINHLDLVGVPKVEGEKSLPTCVICRNAYICIDHSIYNCIDSELCHYQTGVCGHSFHNCCINRWLMTREVCPLCTTPWEVKVKYFN